jgi:predicted metal-dependent HD superfamily phosphohydrolase
MLTDTFLQLLKKYSNDHELANNLWLEIFTKYSEPKRHYHTVTHLEKLLGELKKVKDDIHEWEVTLFAMYYHDIIYKVPGSSNEEDSAKLAVKRLREIGFPAERIEKCSVMIKATKNHELSDDSDTNYFIDADLIILGQNPEDYYDYSEGVRKEYSIYPDFMYNAGRKKVLQHLLQMKRIYKTAYFYNLYEKQARINLSNELESLDN